jgi:Sulfotransferase domain
MNKILEKSLKDYLPSNLALFIKKNLVSNSRYLIQLKQAKKGFKEFGHLYPQNIIFVAGLPKSGTSWLKKMICSYQGYQEVMIPEANSYEISHSGSHNFDLPDDTFSRFANKLVVLKLHVHGSEHNINLLKNNQIPFIIIYRDLRDVAVSYYFYVKQTPWHSEHKLYKNLCIEDGLKLFANSLLIPYVRWIESWENNANSSLKLILRYEDLLVNSEAELLNVAKHCNLDSSVSKITEIVTVNSFANLSGGRNKGNESQNSFFRKGIAGDWKNHFTPSVKSIYKEKIGEFLIKFKYENDLSW